MPGAEIPPEVDNRASLYRSLLDGRRMLIVLDNAATVEQVRPLLPGTPSALVVVTSRDSLGGLVARHGARRLDLDLLPPEDAIALLGALIGGRAEAEPEAAAALAEQCVRLPLALRVAAELTATRPTTPLTALVSELADEQRRLDLLDAGGDSRTAVRAVFSWSYQHLPTEAARAFRLLGLHPGPDFDLYAAAALTHTTVEQMQHLLDLLARAHLVQPASPGRYGMHDLLRAYATHLATTEDSENERQAALTRLFDHYLATAAAAVDTLVPTEQHRRPRIAPTGTPTPPVADSAAAQTWLETERATLTATCAYTATRGWAGHTTGLAATLFRYLEIGGHYPDALTIHTHALRAARDAGDQAGKAHALTNLGLIHFRQSRYKQAAEHYQQALDLCREIGDRDGEARALVNLGAVYLRRGDYPQAAEHHQQALALCREIGYRDGEAHALDNLGLVYQRQGDYPQAAEHHQQALALCREIGDRASEALALTNLGIIHYAQGHYPQATELHQQALALCREIGYRDGEAHAWGNLGLVYQRQGHYPQATELHQQALALCREIGYRAGEAYALAGLGVIYFKQGHYPQATELHQQALALCREIGYRAGVADVLINFGHGYFQQGHHPQAAELHQQALALCRMIGYRGGEARALNGLGETHHATGHHEQAHAYHAAALTLATQIGDRYEQARAHDGLAHTYHAAGDLDQARHHWHQALTLYTDLRVPDVDDVHAHLTALDQATGDDNED